ncbi:hypothetical protein F6W96_28630 [Nocardia terpenica]|uniref:NmrA-like domain-containing protein n=1 Tax=Nocardia terpenica TaxID=455432 RepID=A0A6G9Z8D5_9NOCA|nr:hypothetical protein F6W96_28630 [Nocardia terpenica]
MTRILPKGTHRHVCSETHPGHRRHRQAGPGVSYTLLRPVRFMENYFGVGMRLDGIGGGVHRHLFPADRPVQMIAVDDIAHFAMLASTAPERFRGHTLELAGDAITMTAAAATLSEALGQPVRYEEMSRAQAAALGPQIEHVWQSTREGVAWHADIDALRVIHPGPQTLRGWLDETGAAQLKAMIDAAE